MISQAVIGVLLGTLLGSSVFCAGSASADAQQTVLSPPEGDMTFKSSSPFNPRDYRSYEHMARCPGINRSNPEHSVPTDLQLQYFHIVNPRAPRTLLLVHGWPSLWSSWSNQILYFNNSYSLIIPNLRGFGASRHPGDVQTSGNMPDMVSDLHCIMKNAGVESVTCVGHDWGAQVCWEMARYRPDLVEAVAAAVVPYLPAAGEYMPIEEVIKTLPRLAYQAYFARETQTAVTELNASIRRTLRSVFRTVDSPTPSAFLTSFTDFLGAWRDLEELPPPPFFTKDEEDYIVEQYGIQGFDHTLQFYTTPNRVASFEVANGQGNFTIPQPALSILPTLDPVADWNVVAKIVNSASHIPHLTTEAIPTAHWPQLEKPEEFNRILETWLNTLPPSYPRTDAKGGVGSSRQEGEL